MNSYERLFSNHLPVLLQSDVRSVEIDENLGSQLKDDCVRAIEIIDAERQSLTVSSYERNRELKAPPSEAIYEAYYEAAEKLKKPFMDVLAERNPSRRLYIHFPSA